MESFASGVANLDDFQITSGSGEKQMPVSDIELQLGG